MVNNPDGTAGAVPAKLQDLSDVEPAEQKGASHDADFVFFPKWRYAEALEMQNALVALRRQGEIRDLLIFTEHHPVYTLGKNANVANLLITEAAVQEKGIDLHKTDRGGDITFHGPGQLVGYPIFSMQDYYRDVGRYLREIEAVLIQTLAGFQITASRQAGLTGVWCGDEKIAAIGVKFSRWYTKHGFALNVNTDLRNFDNIIPCGITGKAVTSMQKIKEKEFGLESVYLAILSNFSDIFSVRFHRRSPDEIRAWVCGKKN